MNLVRVVSWLNAMLALFFALSGQYAIAAWLIGLSCWCLLHAQERQ